LLQHAEEMAIDSTRGSSSAPGPRAKPKGPVLSDAVAQRALSSLQEAAEVVLQFVEQSAVDLTCADEEAMPGSTEGAAAAAAAAGAIVRRVLLLAALRVLARWGTHAVLCVLCCAVSGAGMQPMLCCLLALQSLHVQLRRNCLA